MTEDWYVPHDANEGEVDLWVAAGYTTKLMIDAAIHQGDATFNDGLARACLGAPDNAIMKNVNSDPISRVVHLIA